MHAPDTDTIARFKYSDKVEIRIPGKMFRSRAYIELSHTAKHILLLFLHRRTWYVDGKGKNARRIYNNNGLLFSYTEAAQLWGIIPRTFRDGLVQLIENGFLRIEKPGGTFQGTRVPTVYALVDSWQHFGTPLFVKPNVPQSVRYNDTLKKVNEDRKKLKSPEVKLSRRLRLASVESKKTGS